MVAEAHKKMEELFQLQQKPALDPGDLKKIKVLAITLSDDEYAHHLELWTGSEENSAAALAGSTVTTLRQGLTQLKDAADDPTAKGHLDTVFTPLEINESRQLNAHLTDTVEELKKITPHVKTAAKTDEIFTSENRKPITYARAFVETVDELAEEIASCKTCLAPELVKEAPEPLPAGGDYPPVSESHRLATKMLEARREREALKELKTVSERVNSLEEQRETSTGEEDIDPAFVFKRKQVIDELESHCEKCAAKKWLPEGTLDEMHEEGVINPIRVQRVNQRFSKEIRYRQTASPKNKADG